MANNEKAQIHLMARAVLREQKSMSDVPDDLKAQVLEKMAWLRANDPAFKDVTHPTYEGQS